MENQENLTAAVEAQPQTTQRVHRVGTFTMGIALIITGIVLCALIFVPLADVLIVAKLSPLLLVVLGCEVVFYTFKSKETKLKYDILSILMCLFIIFGAVSATILPTLFEFLGPTRASVEQNISADIIKEFKAEKDKYPRLYTISATIGLNGLRTFLDSDSLNILTASDWLYIYAEFNDIESKEAFAKDAIEVYKKLNTLSPARVQLTCTSSPKNNQPYYTVDFRGTYINEPSAQSIIQQIETYVYNKDYGNYMYESEYNEYLENKVNIDNETDNSSSMPVDTEEPSTQSQSTVPQG